MKTFQILISAFYSQAEAFPEQVKSYFETKGGISRANAIDDIDFWESIPKMNGVKCIESGKRKFSRNGDGRTLTYRQFVFSKISFLLVEFSIDSDESWLVTPCKEDNYYEYDYNVIHAMSSNSSNMLEQTRFAFLEENDPRIKNLVTI